MVKTIFIENIKNANRIEISKNGNSPFVLDSVDWDQCDIDFSSYSVPYQIGEFLNGVNVGIREPEITGYIIADKTLINKDGMTWEEYYEAQEMQIEENKLLLDKIISIYTDITIYAGDYMLDGRPSSPPIYSTKETENNEVECYFTIRLKCYNPLFYKGDKTVSLANVSGAFHFPLIIPEDKGVIMGLIQTRSSLELENTGDIDSPCTITIEAVNGSVRNPSVYNVNTGEKIGFSGITMNNGDTIKINTNTGEESAIWHKAEENKDVSLVGNRIAGSSFFKILRGKYSYAYSVEEEDVNNVDITVTFREQFFNFRGM